MNTPTATTATTTTTTDLHAQASRRVDLKLGLLVHLGVFLAVNTGLALLGVVKGGSLHAPFPMWGWAVGLMAHAVGTAISLSRPSLRERMLSAELASLRQR